MSEVVFLYTTWPDHVALASIATACIADGLAACVNSLPGMTSFYEWDGAIHTDTETVALFKTTAARADALKAAILKGHPYDTPAIAAIRIDSDISHSAFLDWIRNMTAT